MSDFTEASREAKISSSKATLGQGVYISTYGCQMNVNDSERMYTLLEMADFTPVSTPEQASLIIINSCAIREMPVHKVHSEVGRYRKLKDRNPALRIGVGGCVGQQEKDKLLKDIPILDFVFGTDSIDSLPNLVQQVKATDERLVSARFEHQKPYEVQTLVRNPGISTFVNITKGCDNFCTFCIVPYTRGRERSRPVAEILEDLHKLTQRGVKEVTLLGQNVNSYESSDGTDFKDLLKRVATETDMQRIRFTTSHPKDFGTDLIEVLAGHRNKICDYIHLPFQSGNSQVLERMNRGYTREHYLEKMRLIQEAIPGVSLSTDIIVGFPGETHEQFEDTMTMLDEVPYESLYAFKYSPRPFTKAARYTDQVEEEVKSERLTRLLAKHRDIAFELAARYEGRTMDVLVEKVSDKDPKVITGRSTQNKLVHFLGPASLIGQTVPVKINKAFPINFRGVMVGGIA
ncbi:MAG: tRNA (N6-isopentenyl adenosine(37)-C2)-methylthiotransferase MiaB [Bdellovibrionales bacterium]